jgi:hypothetical protein
MDDFTEDPNWTWDDAEEFERNQLAQDNESADEDEEEDPDAGCTCGCPGGYCDCPGAAVRAPSIWER